jgi:superfamily II DNA or RNA helicase
VELEVRDYQQRIVANVLDAVQDGHKSVLLESPTGAGKSLMAHLVAKELYRRYGWKTGWTAMRRHLLGQAQADNRKLLGFEHVKYFSMFDKTPPTDVDVLILDEGHHSASETATTLFGMIKPKLFLAMTGTPFRSDRMKLCFSRTIRDAGTRALIDSGWLSPFHQYTFEGNWTPQMVADLYLREPERWGPSVVFFLTLAECFRCQRLLQSGGIRCEVVHGSSDQESQIAAFNRGEVPVLLNVIVLTEGFNAPQLQTVFVRPGSKGPTIQMAGRALRKHPGKPFAQIVQNAKTKWPFTKIASAEEKFVLGGDQWRRREVIPGRVKAASINTILSIPDIDVQLPKFLTHKRNKRRRRINGHGVA